ncbi:MAG TPA: aspartate/glutamate racemase family protein [Solirubrobacteraceae bacterium]
MTRLLVLNPNSSLPVTEAIAQVAAASLAPGSFAVEQIDAGPAVIEDEETALKAAELVCARLRSRRAQYDSFVVACHGDPGVEEAARITEKRVCGIGAASFRAAAARGGDFGVITLGPELVERKRRQVARCGLASHCVAIEPTHTGVLDYVTAQRPVLTPYLYAGRRAIERGATVLVLGCAGMAPAARALEQELDVTVVEPVEAGVREAVSASAPVA